MGEKKRNIRKVENPNPLIQEILNEMEGMSEKEKLKLTIGNDYNYYHRLTDPTPFYQKD